MVRLGRLCAGLVATTIAALGLCAPAQAVGVTLTTVGLDGPLRGGSGFSQSFSGVGSALDPGTQRVVLAADPSNPGGATVVSAVIASSTRIQGRISNASGTGLYSFAVCIVPIAANSCSAAITRTDLVFTVAGGPTLLTATPSRQTVNAGESATYFLQAYDSQGRATQLSALEDVDTETSADAGTVRISGLASAVADLRDMGLGSVRLRNSLAGSNSIVRFTAVGFTSPQASVTLTTIPDPVDLDVTLSPVDQVVKPGTTVRISGRVVLPSGTAVAGARITGNVSGANRGVTTTDTTDAQGRFTVTYTDRTGATTGQEDTVTIVADAGVTGSGAAVGRVVFSASGRTPINDLRLNGLSPSVFNAVTDVIASGRIVRGQTAVVVTAVAQAPGSPVTFTSERGSVAADDGAGWRSADSSVTVTSDPDTGIAIAYLVSTSIGDVDVRAVGANTIAATAEFATPVSAARDVAVLASSQWVLAGTHLDVTGVVRDAFGNPVAGARIVFAIPVSSPGHFANGTNTISGRTDNQGRVSVAALTTATESGTMTVHVAGERPTCSTVNQYGCGANDPGSTFPASGGPASIAIPVRASTPAVVIRGPRQNLRVSYNQRIVVTATARNVAAGTVATLSYGRQIVATALVGASGAIAFPSVAAVGTGAFTVAVRSASAMVKLDIVDYGISSASRQGAELNLGVRTGVWQRGTVIVLTRNGAKVTSRRVEAAGRPLVFTVKYRTGDYQVQVTTRAGVVTGHQARFIT